MSVYGIKDNKCLVETYDKVQADKTFWPNGGVVLYEGYIADGSTVNCSETTVNKIKSYSIIALIYAGNDQAIILNKGHGTFYFGFWKTWTNIVEFAFGWEKIIFTLGEKSISLGVESMIFNNSPPYVQVKDQGVMGFDCDKIVGIC